MASGRIAVVTGTSSGLGRALRDVMAAKGWTVFAVARRAQQPLCTANVVPVVADVGSDAGRDAVMAELRNHGVKKCDALINNAGALGGISTLSALTTPLASWRETMAVNVEAPLWLTRHLMPFFELAERPARVLNITSMAASVPLAGWSPYCSSKAAMAMATRCLQAELGAVRSTSQAGTAPAVLVADVNPGPFESEMMKTVRGTEDVAVDSVEFLRAMHAESTLIDAPWPCDLSSASPRPPPVGELDNPLNVALFVYWVLDQVDDAEFEVHGVWDKTDEALVSRWAVTPHDV